MTIFEAKQIGNKEINSPTTSLDVNCILEYITGFSKTQLLLNSKNELSTEQESNFLEAIKKRPDKNRQSLQDCRFLFQHSI